MYRDKLPRPRRGKNTFDSMDVDGKGGEANAKGGKRARELQIECSRDNCSRDVTAFIKSTPPSLVSTPIHYHDENKPWGNPSPCYPIAALNDKANSSTLSTDRFPFSLLPFTRFFFFFSFRPWNFRIRRLSRNQPRCGSPEAGWRRRSHR